MNRRFFIASTAASLLAVKSTSSILNKFLSLSDKLSWELLRKKKLKEFKRKIEKQVFYGDILIHQGNIDYSNWK